MLYNFAMPTKKPTPIEFDGFLAAEYEYIAETAHHANEDRARVSSFYMIAVGSLVAALLGTQFLESGSFTRAINIMFSGLFLLLTMLGTSTILQLARLRGAWYDAVLAMNQIKDFMVARNEALVTVFRWNTGTLPPKYKVFSISYYQAVEVSIISGLMFGAGVYFFQQAFFLINVLNWVISIAAGIVTVVFQLGLYKRTLE